MRFRVFCIKKPMTIAIGKRSAPGGIRTHGLLSRSQMPYPLGHGRSFLFIIPHSPRKGKPFRNFLPDRELARRKYRLNALSPRSRPHVDFHSTYRRQWSRPRKSPAHCTSSPIVRCNRFASTPHPAFAPHSPIPIQHPVANELVRENLPRIAPLPLSRTATDSPQRPAPAFAPHTPIRISAVARTLVQGNASRITITPARMDTTVDRLVKIVDLATGSFDSE